MRLWALVKMKDVVHVVEKSNICIIMYKIW